MIHPIPTFNTYLYLQLKKIYIILRISIIFTINPKLNTSWITVSTAWLRSRALFIKLLKKISSWSENFKCRFPYFYPHYSMKLFMLMKNVIEVLLKKNNRNMHLKFSHRFDYLTPDEQQICLLSGSKLFYSQTVFSSKFESKWTVLKLT